MEKIYTSRPMPAKKILPKAIIMSFLLSVFLVTAFINPEKTKLLTCQFKNLTGYSCPTCGLTRSFHAFSHLNFQESFRFHLLGPVIYVALLFILIKLSLEVTARKEIRLNINPGEYRIIFFLFFGALFCFWITRLVYEINTGC